MLYRYRLEYYISNLLYHQPSRLTIAKFSSYSAAEVIEQVISNIVTIEAKADDIKASLYINNKV